MARVFFLDVQKISLFNSSVLVCRVDTNPFELAKAVQDPLRSQCPKFDDTTAGTAVILSQKGQDHILACAVFLLESKSVKSDQDDLEDGLKGQMVKYLVEVAKNLDKVEFSPRRFSTNS